MKNKINILKNKKGAVLPLTIVIALFLSILLAAAMARSGIEIKSTGKRVSAQRAFYASETGLERAIFELRRNPQWAPIVGEAQNVPINVIEGDATTTVGMYTLEVEDGIPLGGWNTRWVKATGHSEMGEGEATFVIVARLMIESPSRFMLSTLGDLRIQSGATINSDILARNIFFDLDENISGPEGYITVNGNVYYLSSVNPVDPASIEGIDIDGEVSETGSITFAGVDIDYYREIALDLTDDGTGYYFDGNLDVDLGNLDDLPGASADFEPQIIYAEGNINISGEYSHSLIVISGENTYIGGDIMSSSSSGEAPQLGILSSQDIIIPEGIVSGGDLMIEALVMADGAGESEGIFIAEGPKSSGDTLTFNGSISVRGDIDDPERTAVDLNAFSTRQLLYNAALNNNRNIPFSPYIVNVITWSETLTDDDFPPEVEESL